MEFTSGHKKLSKPIVPAKITGSMDMDEFAKSLENCAFGARRISQAVEIYYEMVSDPDVTKFFGLAGAMVPAGMRTIIADLIKDGYIDVLVTTGANMVHDTLEGLGLNHYKGTDQVDDKELHEEHIDRIYDVYLPDGHFEELEEFLMDVMEDLPKDKPVSIAEFMKVLGAGINNNDTILGAAYENDVPVYCPAFPDSVIGLHAYLYKEMNPLVVDAVADMHDFMDICWDAKKAGAVFVGGGVPKNYIFQSMLVTPKEFDYAIQLTMDTPQTGGLSGATLDEAISWGKVDSSAKFVTVYSDATITLPLMVGAVRSRVAKNRI